MNNQIRQKQIKFFVVQKIKKQLKTSDFRHYGLLSPDETLLGRTLADWSAIWWQWAYSFKQERHPLVDGTGGLAHLGALEELWFLGGSFARTPVTRKVTIPVGKPIFFPIINELYEVPPHMPCPGAVKNLADEFKAWDVYLTINGVALPKVSDYLVATPTCFDLYADTESRAVSRGYWIALTDLPVGEYTLAFGGKSGFFKQDVTYLLEIVEGT